MKINRWKWKESKQRQSSWSSGVNNKTSCWNERVLGVTFQMKILHIFHGHYSFHFASFSRNITSIFLSKKYHWLFFNSWNNTWYIVHFSNMKPAMKPLRTCIIRTRSTDWVLIYHVLPSISLLPCGLFSSGCQCFRIKQNTLKLTKDSPWSDPYKPLLASPSIMPLFLSEISSVLSSPGDLLRSLHWPHNHR